MSHNNALSVLVVSPVAEVGGAETLLIDVMDGLQSVGVCVALIAFGDGPLENLAESRSIAYLRKPGLSLRNPNSILRSAWAVRRAVATRRPDVVLASHPKGQVIVRLACIGQNAVAHATQLYDPPARNSFSTMLAARLPGLRLAITEDTAESYRLLNKRIRPIVIAPGVDRARLSQDAQEGDGDVAWREAGLDGQGPRVVMVGRLQRFKGCFDFLIAAALILQARPDARFLIIGPDSPIEPELRRELTSKISASDLGASVALAGRLSRADLAATVRNATLLVHPAHREPFGLAVVEALSLGTPVVAYGTSGPTTILRDGGGVLVRPNDVDGLANAVLNAINDPFLLDRWKDEVELAAQRFELQASVEEYANVLANICRPPPMPITMVGVSPDGPSGVRDYSLLLAGELRSRGCVVEERWLHNSGDKPGEALRVSLELLRLAAVLPSGGVFIWHYSPVVYGFRGVPALGVLLGPILRLRGGHVISVLHELAYTYRRGVDPPKARIMAAAQQVALSIVLIGTTEVVVTTERRRATLVGQRPRRERHIHVIPVFPTIARTGRPQPPRIDSSFCIGVPGYSGDGVRADLLIRALSILGQPEASRVLLIGAPGADSADGRHWLRLANDEGLDQCVHFTGVVSPGEFSESLLACDVIALMNEEGPSSRKTTLAAALDHSMPVVSLDGYNRWNELVDAGAVHLVGNDPVALSAALVELRSSPSQRIALGERGARFASEYMSLARAASAFAALLGPPGSYRVLRYRQAEMLRHRTDWLGRSFRGGSIEPPEQ